MPGSGVGGQTIGQFLQRLLPLGLKEIHMSGGSWVEGKMVFRREGFGMGVGGNGEWGVWRTDTDRIREVRQHIDRVSRAEAPRSS
jgi:copper homeostasis protein